MKRENAVRQAIDRYAETGERPGAGLPIWTLENVRQHMTREHVRKLLARPGAVEEAREHYRRYIHVPAGKREPVPFEHPRPGDLMLDDMGNVSVAVEADPADIITTEELGPEKRYHLELYTEWAAAGHVAPAIHVIETTYHPAGSLNTRRLLAMQAAGIKRAVVWYSPMDHARFVYSKFYLVEHGRANVAKLHICRDAGMSLEKHFRAEDLAALLAAGL